MFSLTQVNCSTYGQYLSWPLLAHCKRFFLKPWCVLCFIFHFLVKYLRVQYQLYSFELYLLLTILHADSAYCFAASSPWKFVIFGSTTTKVSIYFSSPGPAGPCLCEGCVSFNDRARRIFGSSVHRPIKQMMISLKLFAI